MAFTEVTLNTSPASTLVTLNTSPSWTGVTLNTSPGWVLPGSVKDMTTNNWEGETKIWQQIGLLGKDSH